MAAASRSRFLCGVEHCGLRRAARDGGDQSLAARRKQRLSRFGAAGLRSMCTSSRIEPHAQMFFPHGWSSSLRDGDERKYQQQQQHQQQKQSSPEWARKHLDEQKAAPRVFPPSLQYLSRKHLEVPLRQSPNRLDPQSYTGRGIPPAEVPTYELPFEFQYTYSEVPKATPLAERGPQFSPFGPDSMPLPWCGKKPAAKTKKLKYVIDSFNPPPDKKGVKPVDAAGPFPPGQRPVLALTREDVLGEPLTRDEIADLVAACHKETRQLNIGRDGLTHNMLGVIHDYWKRRRVIKIKCKGVPTIDMDNVCFHLEDKTGGKIIYRQGGALFLFRGRNYNPRFRPNIPLMLWKPPVPIYPLLVKQVPDGLTYEQADYLRRRGRYVKPLCRLIRNRVYLNLANDVKDAFEVDELVKLDCRGLNPSDIRKIGAKLKELLGIVILSFQEEQILLWRGLPKPSEDEKALQQFISHREAGNAPALPTPEQVLAAEELDALWKRADDFGMMIKLEEDQLDADSVKALACAPVRLQRKREHEGNEDEEDEQQKAMDDKFEQELKEEMAMKQAFETLDRTLSTPINAAAPGVLPVDELAKLLLGNTG